MTSIKLINLSYRSTLDLLKNHECFLTISKRKKKLTKKTMIFQSLSDKQQMVQHMMFNFTTETVVLIHFSVEWITKANSLSCKFLSCGDMSAENLKFQLFLLMNCHSRWQLSLQADAVRGKDPSNFNETNHI